MCQEMQQRASKGREEEDCKLVNMGVNNAGSKMFVKFASKMFSGEGNVSTNCVLVSNTECKHNFLFVYKKTPQGNFKWISESHFPL